MFKAWLLGSNVTCAMCKANGNRANHHDAQYTFSLPQFKSGKKVCSPELYALWAAAQAQVAAPPVDAAGPSDPMAE